jgi:hypothetical protein
MTLPAGSIVNFTPALPSAPSKASGYSGSQLFTQAIASSPPDSVPDDALLLLLVAISPGTSELLLLLLLAELVAEVTVLFEGLGSEAFSIGTETRDGKGAEVGAVKSFWGVGCGGFGLGTGGGGVTALTGSGLATGGGGAALTGSGWGVGFGSDLTIGFDSILGWGFILTSGGFGFGFGFGRSTMTNSIGFLTWGDSTDK